MKLKPILSIIVTLFLLASCSKPTLPNDSNANDGITYPETDVSGINSVYIITQNGPVPLSYSNDGVVPLVDDIYYYNLKNVISSDESVKQKAFTYYDSVGHNLGSVSYPDFESNKKEYNPYTTLVSTGNWRLCPDIRTVTYSDALAPNEYTTFIKESFPNEFASTPVTVTNLWETDVDMDGTNEAIVKAKGDNYAVIAMLSQTLGNYILCSDFSATQNYVCQPFFADIDGNGKPSIIIIEGDTLKMATVFKECSVTAQYRLYLPM